MGWITAFCLTIKQIAGFLKKFLSQVISLNSPLVVETSQLKSTKQKWSHINFHMDSRFGVGPGAPLARLSRTITSKDVNIFEIIVAHSVALYMIPT